MKKNYLLLLLLITLVSVVRSQPLIVIPNDSASLAANVGDYFDPVDVHIELINHTGNGITITWGLIDYNMPSQWGIGLCDNKNCYDLLFSGGPYESMPVAAGDTMDMKFQYTAYCVSGAGNANVYAYVTGDSVNSVVHLNYKTNITVISCINGIGDNFSTANLKLYPNPVQHSFVVSGLENAGNLSFEVYDLKGAAVKSKMVQAGNSEMEISVENLPKGEYFLKVFDRLGKIAGTAKLNKVD